MKHVFNPPIWQHTIPACLGAANDGHIAEILREAGPQASPQISSYIRGLTKV